MYEAFPKVIWMSEVVVPGDMDVWGRPRQSPGRGRAELMTGQSTPGFATWVSITELPPKKIATRLPFHYQITTGTIYMAGWWWRIMLY